MNRGATSAPPASSHSIIPVPGELAAVDEGWGDENDDRPTVPVEIPALAHPLDFDIPPAAAIPALSIPPPPAPTPRTPFPEPPPSSAPATLRITTRPPSQPTESRPSTAPGYGYRASQRPDLAGEMKSRFSEGDFSGALLFAEALLTSEPTHEDALTYASSCRVGLAEAYLEELGGRESRLVIRCSTSDLVALDLDPEHGFVMAQIDGQATVDEIIDVCGRAEHEVLRALYDLLRREVICVA
jgi:hypothetical protein